MKTTPAKPIDKPSIGAGQRQNFRGMLEPDGTSLQWTVIRLPFEPCEVWRERKRMRVRGSINGFAFRTSLFRGHDGRCFLLVNQAMRKGACVGQGGMAAVELEPDTEERKVEIPAELERSLGEDRALHRWYSHLNASTRKWLCEWVAQPRTEQTRYARAEQAAERLLLAMEGEQTTPPILQALFRTHPEAGAGWARMTQLQRRGHLLGIFYYRSPEARQKRAMKAVEEALRLAKKTSR